MSSKVVAIIGSYRKGGAVDSAVEAILEGAREKGAHTDKIYLTDRHIEFCRNCRECMQTPGPARGKCPQQDDLEPILQEIEAADALVLGSPVNCGNVTAIFSRFMERLVGAGYWPWGRNTPVPRTRDTKRRAALVATSAMPGLLIPLVTGTGHALRMTAQLLGARPICGLWIGLAAAEPHPRLSTRNRKRARRIGWKLA